MPQGLAQHRPGVGHVRLEDLAHGPEVLEGLLHRGPPHGAGAVGFGLEEVRHALAQHRFVEEVPHPDADAARPVGVGWADAAAGGAHEVFAGLDVLVVRQDQVGFVGDEHLGLEALGPDGRQLRLEGVRVDHHSVREDVGGVRVDDARG